jgi:multidrug efflux pump subunit AcrB
MARGLTVAQVYLALVEKMNVSKDSVTLAYEGSSAQVTVSSAAQPPSLGGLGDIEFTTKNLLGVESTFKLSDIAEITQTQTPNSISRSEQRRYMSVTAALEDGYNVTLVNADAEKAVEKLSLPAGVTVNFTGESETIMGAMGDLIIMLLLGVLIVYLIMVAQFQSLISPFIVMLTVPLAFTGGMLALLIAGYEVSVVSMIGFIMLVGVIVINGIVLIDYIIRLRKNGLSRVRRLF